MVEPIPAVPALPVTPSPGRMNVDYEQRVDFARLRSYRLSRAMAPKVTVPSPLISSRPARSSITVRLPGG